MASTHTQTTQLQYTLQTLFFQHNIFSVLKDVWKSKILCDAFAVSTCIVSNNSTRTTYKLCHSVHTNTLVKPNRTYTHTHTQAIIIQLFHFGFWIYRFTFYPMLYYFILLFFLFCIYHPLQTSHFFYPSLPLFHSVNCILMLYVWECQWKWKLHRYGVKMLKQIKLWKSLSKIIVLRVEGCLPLVFLFLVFLFVAIKRFRFVWVEWFKPKSNVKCVYHWTFRIILYHIPIKSVRSKNQHLKQNWTDSLWYEE